MLFFFRSIFAQTFLNAFLIYRIWKSRDLSSFFKYTLLIIYVCETLLYFTGLLFGNRLSVDTVKIIQEINGVWVIFQLYLTFLILIFDLIFYFKRYLYFSKFREKTIRQTKIIVFNSTLFFIGFQLYIGYNNYKNPVAKHFDYTFNQSPNSGTKPLQTYKMVLASDIHLGYIIGKNMLEKYVDLINSQHPDIIVINGDLIDYDMRPLVEGKMQDELKKLKANKGVFFIPGNHEYKLNPDIRLKWITQSGITILKDTIINIDEKLWLIGRDDASNKKNRKTMPDLMTGFDTGKPCIMLAHQPKDIKESCEWNIPLTLCGHTHRGQVFPANLLSNWLYTNSYGWQKRGNCTSFTTSGLGLSGFPLRIGSRSEIIVFDIKIY